MLDKVCFPCNKNSHFLSNMEPGIYDVAFFSEQAALLDIVSFEIRTFEDALPKIVIPEIIEVESQAPSFLGSFQFSYGLVGGARSAIEKVDVCVEMSKDNGEVALSLSCIPPDQTSLSLSSIKEGDYNLRLALRSKGPHNTIFSTTIASSVVSIHRKSEFIPTYDWKPIHSWETVPSGLDIRLELMY